MQLKKYVAKDIDNSKPFVIYGAGDYGCKCKRNLESEGKKILCFADSRMDKKGIILDGLEVQHIQNVLNMECLFVIASKYHWKDMRDLLLNENVEKDIIFIYYATDTYIRLSDYMEDELDNFLARQKIPYSNIKFDYHLVEHCNLNCKGCLHFSNIAKKEFADIDVFSKNMVRMHEIFHDRVEHIALLGGEPLLHPNIVAFLDESRKIFPAIDIELITNGILLKKMTELFWISVKRNNIRLTVTYYPGLNIYEEIMQLLDRRCDNFSFNKVNGNEWCKLKLNLDGSSLAYEAFAKCSMSNECITLDKYGHLYTCAPGAHMHHFKSMYGIDMFSSPNDYIDIFEDVNAEQILNNLALPKPMCRYCSVSNITDSGGWEVSKKDIREWI